MERSVWIKRRYFSVSNFSELNMTLYKFDISSEHTVVPKYLKYLRRALAVTDHHNYIIQ